MTARQVARRLTPAGSDTVLRKRILRVLEPGPGITSMDIAKTLGASWSGVYGELLLMQKERLVKDVVKNKAHASRWVPA